MDQTDLKKLAQTRRQISNAAAKNPRLTKMELKAHDQVCSEYNQDILMHLVEMESCNDGKLCFGNFRSQPEINADMRALIMDFIMIAHTRLSLTSATLFQCFNIIDRYCSKIIVRSSNFQLLALSALWLASKYTDKKPRIPSLDTLRQLCCNAYEKREFVNMELHILKTLQWSVSAPTHDAFIDILLKSRVPSLDYTGLSINDIKYGAICLSELACFDADLSYNYNASAIALTSVTLFTHALSFSKTGVSVHYSSSMQDKRLVELCTKLLSKLDSFKQCFTLKYFPTGKLEQNKLLYSLVLYNQDLNLKLRLRSQQQKLAAQRFNGAHVGEAQVGCKYIPRTPCTPSDGSGSAIIAGKPILTPPNSCMASPNDLLNRSPRMKALLPQTPVTPPINTQTSFIRGHRKRNSSMMDLDIDIMMETSKRVC